MNENRNHSVKGTLVFLAFQLFQGANTPNYFYIL